MAAAREQATRGWLELRDAVLARHAIALILAQAALTAAGTYAEAEEPAPDSPASSQTTRTERTRRRQLRTGPSEGTTAASDASVEKRIRPSRRPSAGNEARDSSGRADRDAGSAPDSEAVAQVLPQTLEPPPFADDSSGNPDGGLPGPAALLRPVGSPAVQDDASGSATEVRAEGTAPVRMREEIPVKAIEPTADRSTQKPDPSDAPEPAQPAPGPRVPTPTVPAKASADEPSEVDVLLLIRMEIKRRLPYFQGCALLAKRRTGSMLRRLHVTWAVAADGSIKELKLEGVDDPELAACIVHVGSRPLSVQPGVDLVIPAPIVFAR